MKISKKVMDKILFSFVMLFLLAPLTVFAQGGTVAGCPVFPANNIWNVPIDTLPVAAHSSDYVNCIGADAGLHPDFGSGTWDGGPIGIPYTTVPGSQPTVPIHFVEYGDESDPGPYPIPPTALREWGSDHHVLVVNTGSCKLYELYHAEYQADGSWNAGSGAIFDLRSNALRTAGYTSADEAGLPMVPGLVRYDEVASGRIRHALRFTVPQSYRGYVWPARHLGATEDASCPPMGQRFRLRADFDISGFSSEVQVILRALKKYGMIAADDGGAWYISGAPDSRWNDTNLHRLEEVLGSNFEAVDVSSLMVNPDSGQTPITPKNMIGLPWMQLLFGSGSYMTTEYDTNRNGSDYSGFELGTPNYQLCSQACEADGGCMAYTYVKPGIQGANARCWLKNPAPAPTPDTNCISGQKIQ